MPPEPWTPEQDAALLLVWPSVMPIEDVVATVGRSRHAIQRRAQILKVRRPNQRPHKRILGPFWGVPGRFELVLEMTYAGFSTVRIARELSFRTGFKCTKGMVIGKLNRAGLIGAPPSTLESRLARYPEPKGCRYPIGDPLEKIVWCDAPITVFGRSYCDSHHEKCWTRREAES